MQHFTQMSSFSSLFKFIFFVRKPSSRKTLLEQEGTPSRTRTGLGTSQSEHQTRFSFHEQKTETTAIKPESSRRRKRGAQVSLTSSSQRSSNLKPDRRPAWKEPIVDQTSASQRFWLRGEPVRLVQRSCHVTQTDRLDCISQHALLWSCITTRRSGRLWSRTSMETPDLLDLQNLQNLSFSQTHPSADTAAVPSNRRGPVLFCWT